MTPRSMTPHYGALVVNISTGILVDDTYLLDSVPCCVCLG